ncbi:acyl-CoA Delta(11) desaturase [Nilaparvata lugens]|uniref:acyl-CoA Delta(11) desaturase n=1 Tax=Nilaparvata lugens TaxID=108931 RepID=UPI00193D8EA6|nr:acyl-CoA Delta(11) desaturase [Nilaparvata lugens]
MAAKELNDMDVCEKIAFKPETEKPFKARIVWFNAIGFLILHLAALYGVFLGFTAITWKTFIWGFFVGYLSTESVTIGAHRMYTHKAFKATFATRLVINFLFTLAGQNCMWVWVRDHRQHHRYSDTVADPHDASQGFFFSHIGWLMYKKHPEVLAKGKHIDMSDIEKDEIVMFQKKYYKTLYVLISIALPTVIPYLCWGEDLFNSFMWSYLARTIVTLNGTWCVNSWAHLYGVKPYNTDIYPMESEFVAFISSGEGWHNFHHTFPWDFRAAEFGKHYNFSATVITQLAKWGFVYDLKEAKPEMIKSRILKNGDGTHPKHTQLQKGAEWAPWGSKDAPTSEHASSRRNIVSHG